MYGGGAGGIGRGEASVANANVRLLITAGPRLDYLVAMANRARVAFSDLTHWQVQLSAGTTQQANRRPAYVHFAQEGTVGVPATINALAARAKPGECTRLRCLERGCPLRPQAERDSLPECEDPRGRDRGGGGASE